MRLIGYASIEDLQDHLGATFRGRDISAATRILRTAEEAVTQATGGRWFLPRVSALVAEITSSATSAVVTTAIDRFQSSGILCIGSELIRYVIAGDSTSPEGVSLSLVRGAYSTTPAAHAAAAPVYQVIAYKPRQHPVMVVSDFLEISGIWLATMTGTDTRVDAYDVNDFDFYVSQVAPYQQIQYLPGWCGVPGVQEWLLAGIWGYGYQVPADITFATLRIAEDLWSRRGSGTAQIQSQYIDGIGMKYRPVALIPDDAEAILQKYRIYRC